MIHDFAESLTTPLAWNEASLNMLAEWEEKEILKPAGLTFDTYGTARMLCRCPRMERVWVWPRTLMPELSFGLEMLPAKLEHIATENGAVLKNCDEVNEDEVGSVLRSACNLVAEAAPELFLSIRCFLRSLHVLDSPDKDFDVSFSLPHLPNSIFLSIPLPEERDAIARTAEAIVHEVLHLQLSLVERACPIVRVDAKPEYAYAPWRNEYRPLGGVIHGLYVFRGLEALWTRAVEIYRGDVYEFACGRVEGISSAMFGCKANRTRVADLLWAQCPSATG